MDEERVIQLYTIEKWTLRMIADEMKSNHHMIKRILISRGIEITRRRTKRPYTDEHRRKVGLASKGRRTSLGMKMPKNSLYKNMQVHLAYDVSLDWLRSFEDVEKLKFLNRTISRARDRSGFDADVYMQFIEKFYHEESFNYLYKRWLISGDKWQRPSLNHICAKSKGGSRLVDNLQFLTWFENRAKNDMSQAEWAHIKENIKDYLS